MAGIKWMNHWCLLSSMIISLIAVAGLIASLADSPTRDAEQLKLDIASDLPRGTPRETVEKWLSARGYQPRLVENVAGDVAVQARVYKNYFWYGDGYLILGFELDGTNLLLRSRVTWYPVSP